MDRDILTVAKELASVVHSHPESDVAKHCAAIVRESYDVEYEERGERLIVCTALVESGHRGSGGDLPAVIRVFALETIQKRIAWLEEYVLHLHKLLFLITFHAQLRQHVFQSIPAVCHTQRSCL